MCTCNKTEKYYFVKYHFVVEKKDSDNENEHIEEQNWYDMMSIKQDTNIFLFIDIFDLIFVFHCNKKTVFIDLFLYMC